jgi:hypothetical protein
LAYRAGCRAPCELFFAAFIAIGQPNGGRPQLDDTRTKFGADFRPARSLGRRQIVHGDPLRIYSDFQQENFDLFDFLTGM